eukprot:389895_1
MKHTKCVSLFLDYLLLFPSICWATSKNVTFTAVDQFTAIKPGNLYTYYLDGARIFNLASFTTVTTVSNTWNLIVNQDDDQWGLWIDLDNTWGFDHIIPSTFTLSISGNTVSYRHCNMLIAFTDGKDASTSKHFTMVISLDGHSAHMISPGCDSNLLHPSQSLNNGNVYLVMADQPTPGNRTCRPAYIDSDHLCPYDTLGYGPTASSWILTFNIKNHPLQNRTVVTFKNSADTVRQCAFNEHLPVGSGHNIFITGQNIGDEYQISKVALQYQVSDTSAPTSSTPAIRHTSSPTTANLERSVKPTMDSIANTTAPKTTSTGTHMDTLGHLERRKESKGNDGLEMSSTSMVVVIASLLCVLLCCVIIFVKKWKHYQEVRDQYGDDDDDVSEHTALSHVKSANQAIEIMNVGKSEELHAAVCTPEGGLGRKALLEYVQVGDEDEELDGNPTQLPRPPTRMNSSE